MELEAESNHKIISMLFHKLKKIPLIRANITIKSAILTILSNAIKFSPINGKININIDYFYPNIYFEVADQGKGIPDHLKQEAFEPLFSYGEEKGMGLGLAITHEAIQNFNEKIWIEDNKTGGTKICLKLLAYSRETP